MSASSHYSSSGPHRRFNLFALVWFLVVVSVVPASAQVVEFLRITQLHLFLSVDGDEISVTQHYILGNSGQQAVTADESGVIKFVLPASAYQIEPLGLENASLLVEGQVVSETRNIPVGDHSLEGRFSFRLPYVAGEDIVLPVPLAVDSTVVLISGTGWELSGSQLIAFGTMASGGQNAQAYMVDPLNAGDTIRFKVDASSKSLPILQDSTVKTSRDIVVGVFFSLVFAVLFFLTGRRGHKKMSRRTPASVTDEVTRLAALKHAYESGSIDQGTFERDYEMLMRIIRQKIEQ